MCICARHLPPGQKRRELDFTGKIREVRAAKEAEQIDCAAIAVVAGREVAVLQNSAATGRGSWIDRRGHGSERPLM